MMSKKVITVMGPVEPEGLGITDGHNHLWISLQAAPAPDAPVLDQPDEILAELIEYREAGGGSQVDCQPVFCGRDGRKLRWLSEHSGVQVIANTGFHLQQYYPPRTVIWEMDSDEAYELFMDEIQNGLLETRDDAQPVFPGFIKIAVQASLALTPRHLVEAAVEASKQSGYLIEMHTEKGQSIDEIVNFLFRVGMNAGRLVICHIDKCPDLGLHKDLAAAGFLLEYDTFFRTKYHPEDNLWPLIESMVAAGFTENLVLATDLADGSLWQRIGGGPGIVGFLTLIRKRLTEMGLPAESIHAMMGGNIARSLAIEI